MFPNPVWQAEPPAIYSCLHQLTIKQYCLPLHLVIIPREIIHNLYEIYCVSLPSVYLHYAIINNSLVLLAWICSRYIIQSLYLQHATLSHFNYTHFSPVYRQSTSGKFLEWYSASNIDQSKTETWEISHCLNPESSLQDENVNLSVSNTTILWYLG